MELNKIYNGDCLVVMNKLIESGIVVDAIITDPPYGTTDCKWDSVIPFEEMWLRLNKIIKPNGAVVLFGSEPFSSHLRISNIKNYKYDLYWLKNKKTGFQHANNKPLKDIELISIFSTGTTVHKTQSKNRMTYNPQGLIKSGKKITNGKAKFKNTVGKRPSHKEEFIQEFTNYPSMTIKFNHETNYQHPTQKPVALIEYLIKTYTNENELVLDFTSGSGTTAIACINTKRKYICIEKDEKYYEMSLQRVKDFTAQLTLF